jgi:MFS family permease
MAVSGATQRASRIRLATITLCGVQFIDVLAVTSTITAIPAIIRGLAAPPEAAGLLATVYAAFFGSLLVLGSRLGDKYGPRRVLAIGIGLFTAVAGVTATAQGMTQLLIGIALQGTAAALGVPCALRLLLHVAGSPQARRAGLAAWSATGATAGVLGYIVGGVLTGTLGWRAVYAVNVPIGLALLAAILLCVPALSAQDRQRRLDVPGAVLLTGAVMAILVGASLLERPGLREIGLGCLLTGLALGVIFVGQQRRADSPLIPRAAGRSANLRAGIGMSFVNTATTSSAGVLGTLLLQEHLALNPAQAAFILLPFSLGVIAGSALSRPLGARLTDRQVGSLGLAGIGAGNLVLAVTAGTIPGLLVGIVVAGIGLGVAAVAANSVGTQVSDDLTGSAAGLLNTGAQLGTALGVAALVAVAAVAHPPIGTAIGWAVGGALALATSLILLLGGRLGRVPVESARS